MMTDQRAEVIICGAGIAGISAAFHLTVHKGLRNVVLIDERPPMSLTSDKSTECYRNWWPGPGDAMVAMMNRSIDILEDLARESNNAFHLNRRGYLFATARPEQVLRFIDHAQEASQLGAGPLRIHDTATNSYHPAQLSGFQDPLTGADLITHPATIREHYGFLTPDTIAVIHPRRCGWFSAQQLGAWMLEKAREHGAHLIPGRLREVFLDQNAIGGVEVERNDEILRIQAPHFVNAAGPFVQDIAALIDIELPVYSELHIKVSFSDHLGAFPRNAPLVIWSDPVTIQWTDAEREFLAGEPDGAHLLGEFPEGVHARPDGPEDSPIVLILWTYHTEPATPVFPIRIDPTYPDVAMRGLARMVPALEAYFDRPPKPFIDGGYYTKTRENRALVGPMGVEGAWIIGALSGYGLMAAAACGELLATHICGDPLPHYAHPFQLDRYQDPEYQKLLENWGETGQL